MQIHPDLEQQRLRDPDKVVDVIIVCTEFSDALPAELESAGFHVTGLEQAEHGIIYGRIRLADIPALKNVPVIEDVSPDATQYAL